MQRLKHSEIDKEKWDVCVSKASQEHITGYSHFLDIVAPGWQGIIIGDYEAVVPLPVKTIKGVSLLYQPPFFQRIRYFGNTEDYHPRRFKTLMRTNNPLIDTCMDAFFMQKGRPRLNCFRPPRRIMTPDFFTAHHRRNFLKAQKHLLQLKPGTDLTGLLEIYNTSKPENALNRIYSDCLYSLTAHYLPTGALQIWEVHLKDERVGGIITIESQKVKTLLFMAQTELGKSVGALVYALGTNVLKTEKTYDFEGSNTAGVMRFYMGFGGIEEPYVQVRNQPMRILRTFV
jgi:hypothetical protein